LNLFLHYKQLFQQSKVTLLEKNLSLDSGDGKLKKGQNCSVFILLLNTLVINNKDYILTLKDKINQKDWILTLTDIKNKSSHKVAPPFKFNNTWISDPDFTSLIRNTWKSMENWSDFLLSICCVQN
jgi:hypothetical protein